ncbi:Os12g0108800 [Oryza sativa Japonica Group]|uniref:Os12g0108800 protein n=1 Tax=Oryza sativa subsp. japonica TaxID=39947 RepID=Q0IQP3_ORYSJ|nr:Os12g0108800 [Oryza sativa Japonica Group]|eukprot:NP_001065953.2 Os12g0108800 [Oryza sativa Japonica Group]
MLGDPIIDKDVVKKMLEVVPKYLEQVAISIETLLDLATVSIEEVIGRLRAVEQRKKPASSEAKDSSGRLLLTEEDWLARYKAREQEKKGGSSGGNGGGGRNRRRGRGKGRGGGESNRTDTSGQDGQGNTCRNCGKAGHWARDCISKPMKSGEAHLAQEEEATLLLGEVCTISLTPSSVSPPTSPPPPLYRASAPPADSTSLPHRAPTPLTDSLVREPILPPVPSQVREKIHLVEEKVHAQLYNEEQKDDRRWVVDTGATNHMSGAQSAFSNLDSTVSGSVKFGDGSVVRIEGRGTVIFDCKNGEHRFFTDVYFIPKLQTNIISVGQLDEIGGEALVHGGFLRMRDEDGRLLAKIPCTPSRLYVLDLTISWAGCFAARGAENAWRWHDRFGHLNFPALRKMAREGMVRGLPELEQTDQLSNFDNTEAEPFEVEFMAVPFVEPTDDVAAASPPTSPAPGTAAGGRTPSPAPVELATPPSSQGDLDADHGDEAPLRFRRINNVLGDAEVPGLAHRELADELNVDAGDIKEFKLEMLQQFKMSDLGLLSYYLGIGVRQDHNGISLSQSAYALKLLEKTGMVDCNPCHAPMEAKLKLSKSSTAALVDATYYRRIVGGLRYLVNTRPDLASLLAIRFMAEPREDHMAAVKHILRYIAGTRDHGVSYSGGKTEELKLTGYSDSDMAGDVDDRKSTTGVLFFLAQNPITWQSQKQKVVALSSCEAEYVAATTAACQGVWLQGLLSEILGAPATAPILKVYNKSAIALSKNPVHHDRSKHIQTRFHFIRECVDDGKIIIEYASSVEQLADLLTKPLGRQRFQELSELVGVINTKGQS